MPNPLAIDVMAERILDAVAAASGSREASVGPIRRLLAEFSRDQVSAFTRVIQADVYYECEQIAKRNWAYETAADIRKAGKLDEISVTECKSRDIRG